jgi:AmmeMemoRadiSam system protein A
VSLPPPLSEQTRRELLGLARRSLEAAFRSEPLPRLGSDRAEAFGEPRAVFVTLKKEGALRGCIGTLSAEGDLGRTVPVFARKAAFEDPRFAPLTAGELPECEIEISALTAPQPIESVEDIVVGRDGLIFEWRGYQGLLLPQVATEWDFSREQFLDAVAQKAGARPGAWRDPACRIWIFQAEVFGEAGLSSEA